MRKKKGLNEMAKQGLVMDERIRPKIGLRKGILHVLEKGENRVMGS